MFPTMPAAKQCQRPACLPVSPAPQATKVDMANKLSRSNYDEKWKHPLQCKKFNWKNETYVKIEYDRKVVSEAWVLLPDNTVEHLICYPSGKAAKLARRINTHTSPPTTPVTATHFSEKSAGTIHCEKVHDTKRTTYLTSSTVSSLADQVKAATILIDKDPPKRPGHPVLPLAEYISDDRKSWIGTYSIPYGAFVRRTSIALDKNVPPCYTESELKLVDCPLDGNGRAMVRFFYVPTGKAGFWERVERRMLCM